MEFSSISVVVCTYNQVAALQLTLGSLIQQRTADPRLGFEIVVVDDASRDGTPRLLLDLESRGEIRVVRHGQNMGHVQTRNDGILAAKGELVILVDGDCVPDPGFVKAHARIHRETKGSWAVMGSVRYVQEEIDRGNFSRFMDSRYLGRRPLIGMDPENLPSRCFGTGNVSVPKAELIRVGLLDTAFRFYGAEDFDLGLRLAKAGVRLKYCGDARVCHHDEVTLSRVRVKAREYAREGVPVLLRKDPEAFRDTAIDLLLPIRWRHEAPRKILSKLLVRCALNPLTIQALEVWVSVTDHVPALYVPALYRMLQAGWYLQGFSEKPGSGERVDYLPKSG